MDVVKTSGSEWPQKDDATSDMPSGESVPFDQRSFTVGSMSSGEELAKGAFLNLHVGQKLMILLIIIITGTAQFSLTATFQKRILT